MRGDERAEHRFFDLSVHTAIFPRVRRGDPPGWESPRPRPLTGQCPATRFDGAEAAALAYRRGQEQLSSPAIDNLHVAWDA
jgi:hypothetical protein